MVNGGIERAGATLYCYYNNDFRIDQLLMEGNIVDLGSEIGQKHDLKHYELAVSDDCIFRARDGGEPDNMAIISETLEPVYDIVREYNAKFLYLWRTKQWWVSSGLQPKWEEPLVEKLPANITH